MLTDGGRRDDEGNSRDEHRSEGPEREPQRNPPNDQPHPQERNQGYESHEHHGGDREYQQGRGHDIPEETNNHYTEPRDQYQHGQGGQPNRHHQQQPYEGRYDQPPQQGRHPQGQQEHHSPQQGGQQPNEGYQQPQGYQQQPQGGYQQRQGYQQPPQQAEIDEDDGVSRRKLLFGGLGLAGAGAGGWYLFQLIGEDDPDEVAEDFVAAADDADWSEANSLLHSESMLSDASEVIGIMGQASDAGPILDFAIDELDISASNSRVVREDDERAFVELTVTVDIPFVGDLSIDLEFEMQTDDGDWRVFNIGLA